MAVDEAWAIHETLVAPARGLLVTCAPSVFSISPGLFLAYPSSSYSRCSSSDPPLRLPVATRLGFIVSGPLFIGGALGFELVGGRYAELHGRDNLTYNMIATMEESLEMAGVIGFIYALLKYLADNFNTALLRG